MCTVYRVPLCGVLREPTTRDKGPSWNFFCFPFRSTLHTFDTTLFIHRLHSLAHSRSFTYLTQLYTDGTCFSHVLFRLAGPGAAGVPAVPITTTTHPPLVPPPQTLSSSSSSPPHSPPPLQKKKISHLLMP